MSETEVTLSEIESVALGTVLEKVNTIHAQITEQQKQFQSLQTKLREFTKDIIEKAGHDFEKVVDPRLSDDLTKIIFSTAKKTKT